MPSMCEGQGEMRRSQAVSHSSFFGRNLADNPRCTRCKNRGLPCEVASSEDAAMYLFHLSGSNMEHRHESTPGPSYTLPNQPHHQFQVRTSSPFTQSVTPEESKEGIKTPCQPQYREGAQLHTPKPSHPSNTNSTSFQPYAENNGAFASEDHARPPFTDFLRDVLYDQPMGGPAKPTEVPGMAVLDFYDDANLDFKGFDFALLNHWNVDPTSTVPDQPSDLEDPVTAIRSNLVKLWTESPWKWTPQQVDNRYRDQTNLPLPSPDAQAVQIQDSRSPVNRVSKEALHGSCRDRILATVVGTCRESSMATRVASSFPSTETIDSWINIFLAAHSCQVSSWIHYGSLSLNNEPCTEWLAIVAAAGATLTPVPAFRRFGFALQEAVRKCPSVPKLTYCG